MNKALQATTLQKAKLCIQKHNMILHGDCVLAGVSGGADSMCLLHILLCLREEIDFDLVVAHVNHCLRGVDSDADEMLVRRYCESNGLSLEVLRVDCADEAKRRRIGLEECGRELRYEFFERYFSNNEPRKGADASLRKIALAHTLSDRTETLIFNLTRGTALRGLCSIPYMRTERNAEIIRPLLDVTRGEVEAYCAKNGIDYAVDASNHDVSYSRNRIRLNVLPQLREINPGFERSVERTLESLVEDEEYLRHEAEELLQKSCLSDGDAFQLSLSASQLLTAGKPVLRRALRMILTRFGVAVTSDSIARLENVLSGGRVSVGANVLADCRRGTLTFKQELRRATYAGQRLL